MKDKNSKYRLTNGCKNFCNNLKLNSANLERVTLKYGQTEKFNIFRFIKDYPLSILMMFFASLLFNFGIHFFVVRAATIPSGVTSIPTILTYIFEELKPYFSILYLAFNLPILIYFWFKVKKSFIFLTASWMIFQIVWEQILLTGPIQHFLMSNTEIKSGWKISDGTDQWLALYYTFVGAVFATTGIGLTWKFGGSSGGTDVIVYFFSVKKQKPVGMFMLLVSITITFFSFLTIYLTGNFIKNPDNKIDKILGIKTISTIIWMLIISMGVNFIFPKYKKVLVSIYTTPEKQTKIMQHLLAINYWHSFNAWKGTSGYTNREVAKIETAALILEVNFLKREVKKIDPNCWIITRNINVISGKFDTTKID
ncbi:YitT family protein [Candidatus Mycoplasma pogonae]